MYVVLLIIVIGFMGMAVMTEEETKRKIKKINEEKRSNESYK
jgi:hypothetical protein